MIAFFPELYKDELAYSWFSRYYTKSGYGILTKFCNSDRSYERR